MIYPRKTLVKCIKRAGPVLLLFIAWTLVVHAADGSGTNTVNPTTTNVASTGNTLTFTLTAAESTNSGETAITVPSGWSAPQGTSGVAGYTTAATTGMIGTLLDNADSTTGWTTGTACSNGLTVDSTTKFEGSFSIKCANGDEAGTDEFYKTISASNWSTYTTVSFWIRSSVDVVTNRLYFGHAETAVFTGQNDATIGALTANTWTHITHTLVGATGARDAVESFGFIYRNSATAFDNVDIFVDDILIGPGTPTFPGGGDIRTRLMSLSSGQTVTVTYGSGGGASGATAPSVDETSVFTTKTRTSSAGTLAAISSSPTVVVGTGGGDATAPSSTTNLALSGATDSSIDLAWTAPGDDSNTGTASSYDIRYSTSNITDGNFSSATAVIGEPFPSVAGTSEGMTVNSLTANTTYFFAMKTSDEVPNTSGISNVPSLSTSASDGGPSSSGTGGSPGGGPGAPAPLETSVTFSGLAYPGSTLEVFKKASTNDRYILNPTETVSVFPDGRFDVREIGLIGGKYVYALRLTDIDGRSTNVFFNVDLLSQSSVSTENILVPPTVEIKNRLLSRSEDLQIIGYSSANGSIEVDIDGILRGGEIRSEKNGFYSSTIGSGSLSAGTHYMKVRQIDANGKKSDFSAVQAFKKSLLVSRLTDFDDDGKIDITDWSVFLFRWSSDDETLRATIDLDSNGMIDIFDLSIFLKAIQI